MLTTIALAHTPLHPGWGWGPGFWIVPMIFWLLLLGVIVTVIASRRRRWTSADGGGPWGSPRHGSWVATEGVVRAEGVLAERFARGDIEEVEYRARLEVLRSQQPVPPRG